MWGRAAGGAGRTGAGAECWHGSLPSPTRCPKQRTVPMDALPPTTKRSLAVNAPANPPAACSRCAGSGRPGRQSRRRGRAAPKCRRPHSGPCAPAAQGQTAARGGQRHGVALRPDRAGGWCCAQGSQRMAGRGGRSDGCRVLHLSTSLRHKGLRCAQEQQAGSSPANTSRAMIAGCPGSDPPPSACGRPEQ